jgi:hypothetical protein
MKKTVQFLAMLASTAAFAAAAVQAGSIELPLRGSFAQIESQEIEFPWMSVDGLGGGKASVFGRYTEETLFPAVNLVTLEPAPGTATYKAANGDTVSTSISASAGPGGPGVWVVIEIHAIVGGTGRFAGASGTFTVTRQFDDPSQPLFSHGTLQGTIIVDH